MTLESGQGLHKRVEGSFSVFRVASAGAEGVDKSPLALNNAAGLGDTTSSRGETIAGAFCPSHAEIFAEPPQVSLI
jgi:hypothetical protein